MGLNYICSNSTYNLTGSEYTTVFDKKKRLNYIVSGTINQLGLTTDSSASVYSPLKFKLSGNDYYIGRSTTFNTTSSTRILTTDTIEAYYTLYTATDYGSSNGTNSNMTSTSRYVYSTKASYTANTSSQSVLSLYTFITSTGYTASTTTDKTPSITFHIVGNYSSKSSTYSGLVNSHTQSKSGTIGGNGTVNNTHSYRTVTSIMASDSDADFPTEYTRYSTSRNGTMINVYGSRTASSAKTVATSQSTYRTYGAYNYTASTYSTRYTSTYTGTISGVNPSATSTKLTYSIQEYVHFTSISTTTINSSHNFV